MVDKVVGQILGGSGNYGAGERATPAQPPAKILAGLNTALHGASQLYEDLMTLHGRLNGDDGAYPPTTPHPQTGASNSPQRTIEEMISSLNQMISEQRTLVSRFIERF